MRRCLLAMVLGVLAGLGLLGPLPLGTASEHTTTLMQTSVIGRLATGGTFDGRLTVHTVAVDTAGHLVVTGSLAGTATSPAGRATKIPARPFTSPAVLLDLWGTCTTFVLELAPLTLAPLSHPLTLVPVRLASQDAPQEERLFRQALCTVARLQQ
jgi:hypothetical protein